MKPSGSDITAQYPSGVFKAGESYAVEFVPSLLHLDQICSRNRPELRKIFAEALATRPDNADAIKNSINTNVAPLCYEQTRSQELLDKVFAALARDLHTSHVSIWLSEVEGPSGGCCCSKCKGDLRKQFLGEIRCAMKAYEKAKKSKPSIDYDFIFTQGSYPHNLNMLDFIPPGTRLEFYSSFHTYQMNLRENMFPPSVQEMVRRGYRVGGVPSILSGLGDNAEGFCIPSVFPNYVRMRTNEVFGFDMQDIIAWLGYPDTDQINLEALAEYSWNTSGRTAREFAASWAQRHGFPDPEKAASAIEMLEYPSRALAACMGNRRLENPLNIMEKSLATYNKQTWKNALKGFEHQNHEDVAMALDLCHKAEALSAGMPDRFVLDIKMLKCWTSIFETYAAYFEGLIPSAVAKEKFRAEIAELSNTWGSWFSILKTDAESERQAKLAADEFAKLKTQLNKIAELFKAQ